MLTFNKCTVSHYNYKPVTNLVLMGTSHVILNCLRSDTDDMLTLPIFDHVQQGRRKEIWTYTAMAKWLKPYRLMQKLNDYKRENIVCRARCRAHMHTKHANTVGLGA